VLSAGYQLSIAALLLGTVAATGHALDPLAVLGAFGASQLAGALPGPNGASPRDAALVAALVAMGLPVVAAVAAVALKAALAWLPALSLGGISLVLTRRAHRGRVQASPA
jgi:glycosyltransferase 2 family protein